MDGCRFLAVTVPFLYRSVRFRPKPFRSLDRSVHFGLEPFRSLNDRLSTGLTGYRPVLLTGR